MPTDIPVAACDAFLAQERLIQALIYTNVLFISVVVVVFLAVVVTILVVRYPRSSAAPDVSDKPKSYAKVVSLLEDEQGEWYVGVVLERELGKMYRHYHKTDKEEKTAEDESDNDDEESDDENDSDDDDSNNDDESGDDDDDDDDDDGDDDDGDDNDEDTGKEVDPSLIDDVAGNEDEEAEAAQIEAEHAPVIPTDLPVAAGTRSGANAAAAAAAQNAGSPP
jgi:hypothetical protein